jgi:hypothetical protein
MSLGLAPERLQEQKKFFRKHVRNLIGKRIFELVEADRPEVQSLSRKHGAASCGNLNGMFRDGGVKQL